MSPKTSRATAPSLLAFAALSVLALAIGAQTPPATPDPAEADDGQPRGGGSKQEALLQERLFAMPEKQANLLRIEYPPGWIGRRHYHTGDVFLYVLDGQFTIELERGKPKTIDAGEAYHEALDVVMQARNPSDTKPTTILLFQIGDRGERLTISTEGWSIPERPER